MLISTETRAGRTRLDAFRNFAERTKVDDVRSLVAMLVQTDRFGTSIGQALRTHAETSRTKRRQRAEEKAAKLGVKLLFPLVFCLFPAFYVVVLGPSMVRIFRDLVWGRWDSRSRSVTPVRERRTMWKRGRWHCSESVVCCSCCISSGGAIESIAANRG